MPSDLHPVSQPYTNTYHITKGYAYLFKYILLKLPNIFFQDVAFYQSKDRTGAFSLKISKDNHTELVSIDNHTELVSIDNHTELVSKDNHTKLVSKDNHTELVSIDNHTELISIDNHTELVSIDNH